MKRIVISQPMLLPWAGFFEQIKVADTFVHFEDVQFPLGRSFCSRVQVKTALGTRWLTVPVRRRGKQLIRDVVIDDSKDWKNSHFLIIKSSYGKAPFYQTLMDLIDSIYKHNTGSISKFCIHGIEIISDFLNLECNFTLSSGYQKSTAGTEKILKIVKEECGNVYITGHGAKNYLDHSLFEREGLKVEYMNYGLRQYPQLHGPFTPYVSIIDMIAHLGEEAHELIEANTTSWKDFIKS